MTDTDIERDYDWTDIETKYGRVLLEFEDDEITWDDTEHTFVDAHGLRLQREEMALDEALAVIGNELEEHFDNDR